MLTLKLMSGQDLPDDHHSKDYELIQVMDGERLQFITTGVCIRLLLLRS
jgi:hypothetical protein